MHKSKDDGKIKTETSRSRSKSNKATKDIDIEAGEAAEIPSRLSIAPDETVMHTPSVRRNKERMKNVAQIIHGNILDVSGDGKFYFEKRGRKFLHFVLHRNEYQDGSRYDDNTIRARLIIIDGILNSYRESKVGTSKVWGNMLYVGAGAMVVVASVVNSVIGEYICKEPETIWLVPNNNINGTNFNATYVNVTDIGNATTPATNDGAYCLEKDWHAILIYLATNHILARLGFLMIDRGEVSIQKAKAMLALHEKYDSLDCSILEMYAYKKNDIIIKKIFQFISYVRLKFWEEMLLFKWYKDPKQFFDSCKKEEVVQADLNIEIGLLSYFLQISKKLNNDKELGKMITGIGGQEYAESIVDTLVNTYDHKIKRNYFSYPWINRFSSIEKANDISALTDSVFGTKLFIKAEYFSEKRIKRAKMMHSSDSSEDISKTRKSSGGGLDGFGADSDEMGQGFINFSQEVRTRNQLDSSILDKEFVKPKKKITKEATKKRKPRKKVEAKPLDNNTEEPIIQVIGKKTKIPSLEKKPPKKRSKESVAKAHTVISIASLQKQSSALSVESGELSATNRKELYSPTLINRYITECFARTLKDNFITQEALDKIIALLDNSSLQLQLSDLKKSRRYIEQLLVQQEKSSTFRNVLYEIYVEFQSLSISVAALQSVCILNVYYDAPLTAISLFSAYLLHIPKSGVEKTIQYSKKLYEKFEADLRNLLSFNLIKIEYENQELVPNHTMQYIQLIAICTAHLICGSMQKTIHSFDKHDLKYLTMHIISSFAEFYREEENHNFETQDLEQFKYIVRNLYKNLLTHYNYGIVNLMYARYPWKISVNKGVHSDMIRYVIKESIYVTTNSPDLVDIARLLVLNSNLSKHEDSTALDSFVEIAINKIRHFKLKYPMRLLNDEQKEELVENMLEYMSQKYNFSTIETTDLDQKKIRRHIGRMCKKVVGESENLRGTLVQTEALGV